MEPLRATRSRTGGATSGRVRRVERIGGTEGCRGHRVCFPEGVSNEVSTAYDHCNPTQTMGKVKETVNVYDCFRTGEPALNAASLSATKHHGIPSPPFHSDKP